MNYGGKMLNDIVQLIALFRPHCQDKRTLDLLAAMASDNALWKRGHDLFNQIRKKTIKAHDANDLHLVTQYRFEEICAKTLYNLSGSRAPFDPDSPYWIVPNALAFARAVGIEDKEVLAFICV